MLNEQKGVFIAVIPLSLITIALLDSSFYVKSRNVLDLLTGTRNDNYVPWCLAGYNARLPPFTQGQESKKKKKKKKKKKQILLALT